MNCGQLDARDLGRTFLEWDKKEGIRKDGDHLEEQGASGREGWVGTKSVRVV